MSMFDINFYSRKKEYHRYSSDDLALSAVGISSYTLTSAERFFKKDNPDVKEFFTGGLEFTQNQILGIGLEGSMKIMEFDYNEKVYKQVTGFTQIIRLDPQIYPAADYPPITETTIKTFLQKWNDVQIGTLEGNLVNSYRAVIAKIQNSQNSYIEFEANISVLGSSKKISIRLDLMNTRNFETAKTISFKGSPLITEVPKTPAGLNYASRPTGAAAVGAYVSPVGDGVNNPQNTASGPLSLTWDPSIGEFQSGTQQMLVRLLTDIDPANVRDFSKEELDSFTNEDVYSGPDGLGFMGSFTKGEAIPLSSENGNPHLFGPDFKGVCENATSEKVKVTVINRMNYSYRAGTMAVVSRMTGENGNWVITSAGTPADATAKNLSFGNFEYQHHIIPAKKYFTFPPTEEKLMPDKFMSWYRAYFYDTVIDSYYRFNPDTFDDYNLERTKILNILASTLSDVEPDPIQYLKNKLKDNTFINQIISETKFKSLQFKRLLDYGDDRYGDGVIPEVNLDEWQEYFYGLPINVMEKSARLLQLSPTLDGESLNTNSQDPLYALEVPMFWGMVFPDGFKNDGVQRERAKFEKLQTFEIYRNDPNLKEISVLGSYSAPFLGDDLKSLLFSDGYRDFKKTGGFFSRHSIATLSSPFMLYEQISLEQTGAAADLRFPGTDLVKEVDPEGPAGLEPINPKRIQFSPMSINRFYIGSELNNQSYSTLKSMQNLLAKSVMFNKIFPPSNSINFADYGKALWGRHYSLKYPSIIDAASATWLPDNGNEYNLKALSWSEDGFPITRHSPPLGTAFDIVPPVLGFRRLPAVPVLTCKSKIRTSANGLSFTVNQLLGMSPQITISASNPPRVTALPFFAGIGWTDDPGNPGKQNSVPQWGDRNRTDDIDSFGTSALHVRVFEGWPIEQTIYYGQFFTPIHFNPSAPEHLMRVEYADNGKPTIKNDLDIDGNVRRAVSEVDFRRPTRINGSIFALGEVVTKETLAPANEWQWNRVRRAAMLSGGGFAYYIQYIGIEPSRQIISGGSGYSADTVFLFADGTTFQVNVDDKGVVTGIKTDSIVYGEQGFMSIPAINLQPSKQGDGSGAVFGNPSFVVREKIGYDPAPKQVVPITRLTKSSNDGEKIAEGNITTTVNFSDTNKRDFDIFYFFHNDPTHYSMDKFLPFDAGFAQYAIVEVNGA